MNHSTPVPRRQRFGVRREAKRHAALDCADVTQESGASTTVRRRAKAPSPLRSAGALQRTGERSKRWMQREREGSQRLGVRREAKRHAALDCADVAQELGASPTVRGRAKAPSPLRSAGALQKSGGRSKRWMQREREGSQRLGVRREAK